MSKNAAPTVTATPVPPEKPMKLVVLMRTGAPMEIAMPLADAQKCIANSKYDNTVQRIECAGGPIASWIGCEAAGMFIKDLSA